MHIFHIHTFWPFLCIVTFGMFLYFFKRVPSFLSISLGLLRDIFLYFLKTVGFLMKFCTYILDNALMSLKLKDCMGYYSDNHKKVYGKLPVPCKVILRYLETHFGNKSLLVLRNPKYSHDVLHRTLYYSHVTKQNKKISFWFLSVWDILGWFLYILEHVPLIVAKYI